MDIEWPASSGASGILNVRVYPPSPASCQTVMTPDGPVRWSLQDETLLIDSDRGLPASARATEELIRTVMKTSGLAKRFSIFKMQLEAAQAEEAPREAILSA